MHLPLRAANSAETSNPSSVLEAQDAPSSSAGQVEPIKESFKYGLSGNIQEDLTLSPTLSSLLIKGIKGNTTSSSILVIHGAQEIGSMKAKLKNLESTIDQSPDSSSNHGQSLTNFEPCSTISYLSKEIPLKSKQQPSDHSPCITMHGPANIPYTSSSTHPAQFLQSGKGFEPMFVETSTSSLSSGSTKTRSEGT